MSAWNHREQTDTTRATYWAASSQLWYTTTTVTRQSNAASVSWVVMFSMLLPYSCSWAWHLGLGPWTCDDISQSKGWHCHCLTFPGSELHGWGWLPSIFALEKYGKITITLWKDSILNYFSRTIGNGSKCQSIIGECASFKSFIILCIMSTFCMSLPESFHLWQLAAWHVPTCACREGASPRPYSRVLWQCKAGAPSTALEVPSIGGLQSAFGWGWLGVGEIFFLVMGGLMVN